MLRSRAPAGHIGQQRGSPVATDSEGRRGVPQVVEQPEHVHENRRPGPAWNSRCGSACTPQVGQRRSLRLAAMASCISAENAFSASSWTSAAVMSRCRSFLVALRSRVRRLSRCASRSASATRSRSAWRSRRCVAALVTSWSVANSSCCFGARSTATRSSVVSSHGALRASPGSRGRRSVGG